jgi:hypothetical protein
MIRILGVLGVGAAVMYFFDPISGKRRRALLRDKVNHYQKEAREYAAGTAQGLRNRAQGVVAEARGVVKRKLGERRAASTVDIDLSQQQ